MIRVDGNEIEWDGYPPDIMVDLTLLIHELYHRGVLDAGLIEMVVKDAMLTKEELQQRATLNILETMTNRYGEEAVRHFINGGKDE